MFEEPEQAEAVVDRDQHTPALGQGIAVVPRLGSTAVGVIAAVEIAVFQAAPGDNNGNREVNGDDIVAILTAKKFGTGEEAGWGDGDYDGNRLVDGDDIVALLAAKQFGVGPYAKN